MLDAVLSDRLSILTIESYIHRTEYNETVPYDRLQNAFRGVNFVTPTPFSDDGETVKHNRVRENASALQRRGARLLIPCGGVGEYYSLSTDERVNVVQETVEATDDETYVIGGVSGSQKNARELVNRYERAGADGIMLIFPHFPGMHEQGLRQYYESVIESTDLGVMIYLSDSRLTRNVLEDLVLLDNVVAVKYALNEDIRKFIRTREISNDVVWVNGNAEEAAPAMAIEGAEGFTTGIGNFVPELSLSLMETLREEDWARARRIRDLAVPLQRLRQEPGEGNSIPGANSVGVVKHGMNIAGLYGGPVREPHVYLTEADRQRVETYYDTIKDAELS